MWQVLSFHGRFDPEYLATLEKPGVSQPGERPEEEVARIREAVEARARYRHGVNLDRVRQRIDQQRGGQRLTPRQLETLTKFDDGTLLADPNRLTKIAGHGRLKRQDGSFLDIGGSTGGYYRTVLGDWSPPDTSEFSEEPWMRGGTMNPWDLIDVNE